MTGKHGDPTQEGTYDCAKGLIHRLVILQPLSESKTPDGSKRLCARSRTLPKEVKQSQ